MAIIDNVTKPAIFDFNIADMAPDQLKLALLIVFQTEKHKIIESSYSDLLHVI